VTIHVLKTHTDPFEEVWNFRKLFEWRKNDRGYQAGDWLVLREWDAASHPGDQYSNRRVLAHVPYVLRGPSIWGVPEGYCVMSIAVEHPRIERVLDSDRPFDQWIAETAERLQRHRPQSIEIVVPVETRP
jgi:hypothetical protein